MAEKGRGVGRLEGKVYFVDGAVVGDTVLAEVLKEKASFAEARLNKLVQASPERRDPFCRHFELCGGCRLQHLSYEGQLQEKQKQVEDAFHRLGHVEVGQFLPIVPSEKTTFYRNKLEFTFGNKRWLENHEAGQPLSENGWNGLGYHMSGLFDRVLDIQECYHQPEPSNSIRNFVRKLVLNRGYPFYDLKKHSTGWLRNLIVRDTNLGHLMVVVQVAYRQEEWLEGVLSSLMNQFPQITTLLYVINGKVSETFHDLNVHTYFGPGYIVEEMEGLRFRIGPKSFFQTNSGQALRLYELTRTAAQLTGNEVVYDLYTGTGTIAQFVARQARKVIGIEYVESAVADAKLNAQINGLANTEFYAGDMGKVLNREFIDAHGRPDVIITDPPRAGMHADVISALLYALPKRIVYVSCNPATQARDVAMLDGKYRVVSVQPVDMFPHTDHVESVALLQRKV